MRKIKLVLPILTIGATIGLVAPALTSCGDDESNDPDAKAAFEYIHDRSFSLLGSGISGGYRYMSWGTAWIISDATPTTFNDYQYYIATNWHVVLGHQSTQSETSNFHMYFGDNTKSSGLSVLSDYTQFTSYTLESESNFYFTSRTDAIDFYVAKADFSSASGTTKTKLNKLNSLQQEKGYITQFAPQTTDTTQYITTNMYIGGFPVKNEFYATWEKHCFNTSNVGMYYTSYKSNPHNIDKKGNYIDNAPQYIFDKNMGSSWMSGGASGSMLLGKFEDGFKVCGIYWGGWTNEAQTTLYPSFSIFNSSKKDFISQYLPN